jgi:lipopolysaccharide biosynthesis glycosyltransferase
VQRNKVAFVVGSQGRDIHSFMTRVAIVSLRISNPNLQIVLCVDLATQERLKTVNDPLMEEADEVVAVRDIPFEDSLCINRFIKTHLLRWVEPPVLFLDSDILVRQNIEELFNLDGDIALVVNNHGSNLKEQMWEEDAQVFHQLNWEMPQQYFNGGVVFYQNTEKARSFSALWNKHWQYSVSETHRYRDQPALNRSLTLFEGRIVALDFRYNHQFRMGGGNTKEAKIWHYFYSGSSNEVTEYQEFIDQFSLHSEMDYHRVYGMMNKPNPWSKSYHRKVERLKWIARKHKWMTKLGLKR